MQVHLWPIILDWCMFFEREQHAETESDKCLALMVKKEFEHLPNSGCLNRLRNEDLDLRAGKEAADWIGETLNNQSIGPIVSLKIQAF